MRGFRQLSCRTRRTLCISWSIWCRCATGHFAALVVGTLTTILVEAAHIILSSKVVEGSPMLMFTNRLYFIHQCRRALTSTQICPVMANLRFHSAKPNAAANIGLIIEGHGWMSPKTKSGKDYNASASAALDSFDTFKKEAFDAADLGFLGPYEMLISGFHRLRRDTRYLRAC